MLRSPARRRSGIIRGPGLKRSALLSDELANSCLALFDSIAVGQLVRCPDTAEAGTCYAEQVSTLRSDAAAVELDLHDLDIICRAIVVDKEEPDPPPHGIAVLRDVECLELIVDSSVHLQRKLWCECACLGVPTLEPNIPCAKRVLPVANSDGGDNRVRAKVVDEPLVCQRAVLGQVETP